MAKRIGSQLDLQKIPVLGLVAESSPTAPSAPANGQLWLDTSDGRLYIRESGSWELVSQVGSELLANKGQPSGYASLDGGTKVPIAELPTGTGANTVALGDDSRFTDGRIPDGAAGGGLSGSYPDPDVADAYLTAAKFAAAHLDGIAEIYSLRTLGGGATQALAGNTTLSDLPAGGDVDFESNRVRGVGEPLLLSDAATKEYVDALRDLVTTGLDVKESVRVATTGSVGTHTFGGGSGPGRLSDAPDTVDGVGLAQGDRVLVKAHSDPVGNGIYVVSTLGTGSNGVWDRAPDFDAPWFQDPTKRVSAGAFTFVEEGSTNADSGWVLTADNPLQLNTTALTFAQFSGAGTIVGGDGLIKTGNVLDVGAGTGITVTADDVSIASTYPGQTSITTVGTITTGVWNGSVIAVADGGTGASTPAGARASLGTVGKYAATLGALTAGVEATITHSLGTTDVQTMFRTTADGYDIVMNWRVIDADNVGVTADIAFSSSAVRAVVVG